MKERNNAFMRKTTQECIDEETGEYVKYKAIEDSRYRFYLRFIKTHFRPCNECQKELHKLVTKADYLILGNPDYDPPIEFNRYWELDDSSWKELERRPPTKKDFKRIYHSSKHPNMWKELWEEREKDDKQA